MAGCRVHVDAAVGVVQRCSGRIDTNLVALNDSVCSANYTNTIANGVTADGVAGAAKDKDAAVAVAIDFIPADNPITAGEAHACAAIVGDGVAADRDVAGRGVDYLNKRDTGAWARI
jgi:hypothetical protein